VFTIYSYSFLHVHNSTHVVIERLNPSCASFLPDCRSKNLVRLCRKRTKHYIFCCIFGCWFSFTFTCILFYHITLTFTCEEGARQFQDCVKGGGIYFLQNKCLNKIMLIFLRFLQYTWSRILKLIQLIPQSITTRVTAPCVLRASRNAYRLRTKITIFAISIYKRKIKWQYAVCTCTIILVKLDMMCLLVSFPSFQSPKVNICVNKCINGPQTARS